MPMAELTNMRLMLRLSGDRLTFLPPERHWRFLEEVESDLIRRNTLRLCEGAGKSYTHAGSLLATSVPRVYWTY